jgi:hypothetical protein
MHPLAPPSRVPAQCTPSRCTANADALLTCCGCVYVCVAMADGGLGCLQATRPPSPWPCSTACCPASLGVRGGLVRPPRVALAAPPAVATVVCTAAAVGHECGCDGCNELFPPVVTAGFCRLRADGPAAATIVVPVVCRALPTCIDGLTFAYHAGSVLRQPSRRRFVPAPTPPSQPPVSRAPFCHTPQSIACPPPRLVCGVQQGVISHSAVHLGIVRKFFIFQVSAWAVVRGREPDGAPAPALWSLL